MFQPGIKVGLGIVDNAVAVFRFVDAQEGGAGGHDHFVIFALGFKFKGGDIDKSWRGDRSPSGWSGTGGSRG